MIKKLLVVLLGGALAVPAFAQSQTNKRAEAYYHFAKARILDDQGQLGQAIDEFKRALELDANNSLIYSEMAQTYLRNNRTREATDALAKAISLDKDNIEAHRLLGGIYIQALGRATPQQPPTAETINAAVREFEEIIRLDPMDRGSYQMLGRLYTLKGDNDKAAALYKKMLQVEPGSEEGITSLAKLYMEAGNFKEAADLLEAFVKQRPDSDGAFQALGELYTQLEEFDKAAEAYRHAAELAPDDIEIKKAEAEALVRANKLDEAARRYEEIVKAEPEDGLALLSLGQIYSRQMKYDLARQTLLKAAASFPDSPDVQFNLVMLDRDQGRLEDALKRVNDYLKKSERGNGRYNEAERRNRRVFLVNQGILNQTLGNYDAAIRSYLEVKMLTNEVDAQIDGLIIETYRSSRNLDKAIQHAEQALAANPNNRQMKIVHADLIAEKGKVDDGIKALQQLQAGTKEDLDVLSTMANVYERAKKFDQAQGVMNTAIQRFPNEPQVYFLQGSLYEKQKKYDDAEKAFRKSLELQKDDPAVLNYLGYMLAVRGVKLDEAEALVKKAVQSDPTNGAYLDSLGWVYFKQNRLELAEEYLKKAAVFVSTDPDIHDHLGDLYFKTKRYDEARTSWTKSIQLSTEPDEIARVKKKLDDLKTVKAANK